MNLKLTFPRSGQAGVYRRPGLPIQSVYSSRSRSLAAGCSTPLALDSQLGSFSAGAAHLQRTLSAERLGAPGRPYRARCARLPECGAGTAAVSACRPRTAIEMGDDADTQTACPRSSYLQIPTGITGTSISFCRRLDIPMGTPWPPSTPATPSRPAYSVQTLRGTLCMPQAAVLRNGSADASDALFNHQNRSGLPVVHRYRALS